MSFDQQQSGYFGGNRPSPNDTAGNQSYDAGLAKRNAEAATARASGSLPNWAPPSSTASSSNLSGQGRLRDHPVDTAIGIVVVAAFLIGILWLNNAFNEDAKPQRKTVQQYMPPSPPYDPKDPYAASRKQWQDWNAAHPNGKK